MASGMQQLQQVLSLRAESMPRFIGVCQACGWVPRPTWRPIAQSLACSQLAASHCNFQLHLASSPRSLFCLLWAFADVGPAASVQYLAQCAALSSYGALLQHPSLVLQVLRHTHHTVAMVFFCTCAPNANGIIMRVRVPRSVLLSRKQQQQQQQQQQVWLSCAYACPCTHTRKQSCCTHSNKHTTHQHTTSVSAAAAAATTAKSAAAAAAAAATTTTATATAAAAAIRAAGVAAARTSSSRARFRSPLRVPLRSSLLACYCPH